MKRARNREEHLQSTNNHEIVSGITFHSYSEKNQRLSVVEMIYIYGSKNNQYKSNNRNTIMDYTASSYSGQTCPKPLAHPIHLGLQRYRSMELR